MTDIFKRRLQEHPGLWLLFIIGQVEQDAEERPEDGRYFTQPLICVQCIVGEELPVKSSVEEGGELGWKKFR